MEANTRFTRLVTVRQVDEYDPYGLKKWLCQCDCGNTVITSEKYLLNGHKKSCGCLQRESRYNKGENLIGKKFNRLTVIAKSPNSNSTKRKWICRCDCGNIIEAFGENLKRGNTKSCGCLNRELARARYRDITGQRFGKLVAIERYNGEDHRKNKTIRWLCQCDCGNTTVVTLSNLTSGHTTSCGCAFYDSANGGGVVTHGITMKEHGKKLQGVHSSMISRCYRAHREDYKRYGARGITVCDEWYTPGVYGNPGLVAFYNWAINNGYRPGLSIDRIDNDGPYAPWNCRWVTMSEQSNNKSTNSHITDVDGEVLTYKQFEDKHNLKPNSVSHAARCKSSNAIAYETNNPEYELKFTKDGRCIDSEGFLHLIPRYDMIYKKEDNN